MSRLSTQLAALEALLEAAPLNLRASTWPSKDGQLQAAASELETGDGARGYLYDIQLAGQLEWQGQSDLVASVAARVDVVVFVPFDHSRARLDEQRSASDYAEDVLSRIVTSRAIDAIPVGLHAVQRMAGLDHWALAIPIGLRYEHDQKGE